MNNRNQRYARKILTQFLVLAAAIIVVIADDSGLEVDALNGQPGVYSARFSGAGATDSRNVDKLLSMLGDTPAQDRTARFRCLMVYMRHAQDATPVICEGTWEGFIHTTSRGENGFGYDPVFWVASEQCCVAELESVRKNQLSHRVGRKVRATLPWKRI